MLWQKGDSYCTHTVNDIKENNEEQMQLSRGIVWESVYIMATLSEEVNVCT